MATQNGWFGFTFEDELGTQAQMRLYTQLDDTLALSAMIGSLAFNAAILDALSSGFILRQRLVVDLGPVVNPAKPLPGSRVEQCGLFQVLNTDNSRLYAQPVPCWSNAKITGGKIPLLDADVANLRAQLIAPFGGGVFTTPQFDIINGVAGASIGYRRKRLQLDRTSKEIG